MSYRTERVDAADVREPLIRLWTENLHVLGDPDAKLHWFYVDGPSTRGEAFLLRAADDSTVGCIGLRGRDIRYREQSIRAALLADFVVDKHHRSALPALTLQRAVQRHVDDAYDLSYGFPNKSAIAVLRRIGYHELGHMTRYVRVLRHGPQLRRRYGDRLGLDAVGAVVDRAAAAATIARWLPSRGSYALDWLADFDDRFDALWESSRPRELITCRRSADFLRWRFSRKPGETYAIAALTARRGGKPLVAYAIVRGAAGEPAELVDLFGADVRALDALLARLVPALYHRGHTTIGMRYLGHPQLVDVLARHWFTRRDDNRVVMIHLAPTCPLDGAIAREPRAWYLTDLDEDT